MTAGGGMGESYEEDRILYTTKSKSDGSTASYYELPPDASELQDLISHKDMNAQVGEAFRSLYRFGESSHSTKKRDARKVIFYMQAEIERITKYETNHQATKRQLGRG